ncbi:unnamed protein product [Cyprideis torosa]|uniref:Uncharacterized protein n=1 Tax=Cyprideis torosa TaxID=163714 RepID=A0A7R8W4Q6_9CRUS|nr:unnamed protein product [Cyprideis torosa]CAG0880858.1 unnamed protein product [Cyprideis torosa]
MIPGGVQRRKPIHSLFRAVAVEIICEVFVWFLCNLWFLDSFPIWLLPCLRTIISKMTPPAPLMACDQPMSRTYQYRKVMKPLLERKRRARINRYLDEMKELMIDTLQAEGENAQKLEKADVLELTVKYLRKLKAQNRLQCPAPNPLRDLDRFKSGFTQCATEISKCLSTIPGVNVDLGTRLMSHLGRCVQQLDQITAPPQPIKCLTPPLSPPRFPEEYSPSSKPLRDEIVSPVPLHPSVSMGNPMPIVQNLVPFGVRSKSCNDNVWRPW